MSHIGNSYLNDFAMINKSYAKDLRWSIVLYRSWMRAVTKRVPFFVVVPECDVASFVSAFESEIKSGNIDTLPDILSEQALFRAANVNIPQHFDGWHTQQVVKLCFAKCNIARNYLTVDSNIVFTKDFNYLDLMHDGSICTAATPISKNDFFGHLKKVDEKGWLDGNLVNLSESFARMCEFMGNDSAFTNGYISCTGMFNSDLSRQLDAYARAHGVDGYVGLLKIAPYEFAWYGEFVFSQHRDRFRARDPHLMTLVHSPDHVTQILDGSFKVFDHHYGLMFQLPAATLIDPEAVYDRIVSGALL